MVDAVRIQQRFPAVQPQPHSRKNPMHQRFGTARPSSVFRNIGARRGGFVDSPSLIALNRARIDVIAASIVPEATAILPRAPQRSSNHSSGGIERGAMTMAVRYPSSIETPSTCAGPFDMSTTSPMRSSRCEQVSR